MLATLIPLFDKDLNVCAYSVFAQKKNLLLDPSYAGVARLDGASQVVGFELVDQLGLKTLSDDREVFIEVNNISIFSDISEQTSTPHDKIVLLMNPSVEPTYNYLKRINELKKEGYKLGIRKIKAEQIEEYKPLLQSMDYIFLNHHKYDIEEIGRKFQMEFPTAKLVGVAIDSQEEFDFLTEKEIFTLYEGQFFHEPKKTDEDSIAPLKLNYIKLLNTVNDPDYDLTKAADVIEKDPALVITLLKVVKPMARNSEITSVRYAAAMLGQKELRKWINTAVANELCADKPSEIIRTSLLRAKFAENLAPLFNLGGLSAELYLVGLFSVLDVILDLPMEEALKKVRVSKAINDALLNNSGEFAPILDFIKNYETASWQEVSRLMIIHNLPMDQIHAAYVQSLGWFNKMLSP